MRYRRELVFSYGVLLDAYEWPKSKKRERLLAMESTLILKKHYVTQMKT
jgi:hypothetical protein